MRLQLRARGVWLPRDERDAVEWRRVQRARNEAPSDVVVLQAVRQSSMRRAPTTTILLLLLLLLLLLTTTD